MSNLAWAGEKAITVNAPTAPTATMQAFRHAFIANGYQVRQEGTNAITLELPEPSTLHAYHQVSLEFTAADAGTVVTVRGKIAAMGSKHSLGEKELNKKYGDLIAQTLNDLRQ